jgi:ribosomal protein S18 acetylase RimI-like enzyme
MLKSRLPLIPGAGLRFITAGRLSPVERAALMNAMYADYFVPLHLTPEGVQAIDRYYDVDPGRSVVALVGRQYVGMALVGLRGRSAWLSGVGVLPEYRRSGIGMAMMTEVLRAAADATRSLGGLASVSLEVIRENAPAWALYERLGFQAERELLTWKFAADNDPLPVPEERLKRADPGTLLDVLQAWQATRPCWQRSRASLQNMGSGLEGYALEMGGRRVGACLVAAGDASLSILAAGVDPEVGLRRCGRQMLQALAAIHVGRTLNVINVPADDPLNSILAALRFTVTLRQHEMVRLPQAHTEST